MVTETSSESGLTLLSLVSRQVWPHILVAKHLKPSRLILLHSDDADESRRPAGRLKRFFDQRSQIIDPGSTHLQVIPHDDFTAVERRLSELKERFRLDSNCALNFTGGNKLMATAAFRWAAEHRVRSFYLERGNRLTWFEPSGDSLVTHSQMLDGSITNFLDPIALLRCQLLTSEVEREGERLTLGGSGQSLSENEFLSQVRSGSMRELKGLMEKTGDGDPGNKEGDRLELAAAAVLLKLSVAEVRRSLRLKVNTPAGVSSRLPHTEIDLLFNWNGRLWIVDCKDRMSEDDLMARLRQSLQPSRISENAMSLLDRIGNELQISQTKVLKEDLVAVNDIGGLLGQVVCVRKSPLPEEAHAYARRNRVEVVQKEELFEGFRRLLHPGRPPSPDQFAELEKKYSKPSGQRTR